MANSVELLLHRPTFDRAVVEAIRADEAIQLAYTAHAEEYPDEMVYVNPNPQQDEVPIPRWIAERVDDFNVRSVAGPLYLVGALPYVLTDTRGVFTPAGLGLSFSLPPDPSGSSGNTLASVAYEYTPEIAANAVFDTDAEGRFIASDITMTGLSSGFVVGNTTGLHGLRGLATQQLTLDSTKEVEPREEDGEVRWSSAAITRADRIGGSAEIAFEPGCYVITGNSSAGKSTLCRALSMSIESTATPRLGTQLISWGEPERGSIDGNDIASFTMELSAAMSLHRSAVVDSLRFFQLFGAGPSGSKGLSKGLLAILTSLSRVCANLGCFLIVVAHPFELAGKGLESQYAAFVGELKGAATGIIEPRWENAGMRGTMSIRRPYDPSHIESGRAPFTFQVNSPAILASNRAAIVRRARLPLLSRPRGQGARRTVRITS